MNEEWIGRRIKSPYVLKVLEPTRRRRFLYLVTEYIEGQTLEQWIIDNPLPDIQTVRPIVEQIIKGLRAFHRKEMVHQDLKPGNIMITKEGVVKIIDLGSTKVAGISEVHSARSHNDPLGTVDYAAPEYFQGLYGTALCDIYSLGTIVYEMLCKKLPYGKPLTPKTCKNASYIAVRQTNEFVPAWVDAAIEKSVALNPKHRYQAMSEFMADLRKPNPAFVHKSKPLLERNPLLFWKWLSLLLLLSNVITWTLMGK